MKPYTFRIVFSGPGAFVPNKIAGSGGSATSWSLVMPQLDHERQIGRYRIRSHYSVVQYPSGILDPGGPVDLTFTNLQKESFELVRLNGHQVRIRTVKAAPLIIEPEDLPKDVLDFSIPPSLDQLKALAWIPSTERTCSGAGTFGPLPTGFFNLANGFPNEGDTAAHVIIDKGNLMTLTLGPPGTDPAKGKLRLWDFKLPGTKDAEFTQGVAFSTALVLRDLTDPIEIVLATSAGSRSLKISAATQANPPEIIEVEIKTREMDEVVGFDDSTLQEGEADQDFRVVHLFSNSQNKRCLLPHLSSKVPFGGLGTIRATCGCARFAGFHKRYNKALQLW